MIDLLMTSVVVGIAGFAFFRTIFWLGAKLRLIDILPDDSPAEIPQKQRSSTSQPEAEPTPIPRWVIYEDIGIAPHYAPIIQNATHVFSMGISDRNYRVLYDSIHNANAVFAIDALKSTESNDEALVISMPETGPSPISPSRRQIWQPRRMSLHLSTDLVPSTDLAAA